MGGPRLPCWLAVALCAAACGEGATPAAPTGSKAADASADAHPLDLLEADSDAVAGSCPGSPGCACNANEACSTGACVDDGQSVTAKSCAFPFGAGCAAGYVQFTAQVGEGVTVCVPAAPKLCNPCETDQACATTGGSGALCVDHGAAGRFCGVACPSVGCPAGYACADATGSSGAKAKQCQPSEQRPPLFSCPCSPAAVAQSLATPCQQTSAAGSCGGLRTCWSSGLSACTGKAAATETCNGQDDDCNGQTDEGPLCDDGNACSVADQCQAALCKPGLPKACSDQNDCTVDACDPTTGNCAYAPTDGSLCNDGNPCTAGEKCAQGVCGGGKPTACPCAADTDCAAQEDGNACNGTLYCDAKTNLCTLNPATVVVCPATLQVCQPQVCMPTTGVCAPQNLPDSSTCSDGLPWTIGDNCQAGLCVPGLQTKLCKTTADCVDDGDLCNGVPFCNKATGVCQLNPTTVVYCPTADDTACRKNLCGPKTGLCTLPAMNELKPCDDGNLCTAGEACQQSKCGATGLANICQCQSDAECAPYEDGDLCNGTLYCNLAKTKCEVNPKTPVVCETAGAGPCNVNTCTKLTGKCALQPTLGNAACDADGSPCTPFDQCQAGKCVADTANVCQCQQDTDCVDDGDLCNGLPYCDKAKNVCKTNPATVKTCAKVTDTACSKSLCQPATGTCKTGPVDGPCSDGNACTVGDSCAKGLCKSGGNTCVDCKTAADCDDSNPCTAENCDTVKGCVAVPLADGATCSDGNLCTLTDGCGEGACVGVPKVCAGNATCNLATGECGCPAGTEQVEVTTKDGKKGVCSFLVPLWGPLADSRPALEFAVSADQTTVADSKSGLVWQHSPPTTGGPGNDGRYDWLGALAYCDALTLANQDDWRLASVVEAASIVDWGKADAAADETIFVVPTAGSATYWTRTAVQNDATAAWGIYGKAGESGGFGKTQSHRLRCVRAGAALAPVDRFAVKAGAGGDVVTDALFKLTWQRTTSAPASGWQDAKTYCDGLQLQGGNWRLPLARELQSLVDFQAAGPVADKTAFPDTAGTWYWSGTAFKPQAGSAWTVHFANGGMFSNNYSNTNFRTRCVR